jgi:ELWxxDGT repeat protein
MVEDINASGDSAPSELTAHAGLLYFFAGDGTTYSLWRSDGTAVNTVPVAAATVDFNGHHPTSIGTALLFFDGGSLYATNGTTTQSIANVTIELNGIRNRVAAGGAMYFSGHVTVGAETTGNELWRSDGTSSGTALLSDINAGFAGSSPSELTNVNGIVYFNAYTQSLGEELYKTDGTALGTALVADINPLAEENSSPHELTNFNGTLVFTANDGVHGVEMWKTRQRVR